MYVHYGFSTNNKKGVIMKNFITSQQGNTTLGNISVSAGIVKAFKRDKFLWLLIIPGLVWYAIFVYGPMYGIIIAFEDFSPFRGILAGPWVNFKWFIQFFESEYCWRIIRNTVLLNIYNLILGFPVPIILALVINEIKNKYIKNTVQTISYMPHFISTVVVVGMILNFLSPSSGIINHVIELFGSEPIHFMVKSEWFRSIYIASGIWQEMGWKSIIFLAAISSINQELYEASRVDGAGKFRQVIHITIPAIMPTILIILLVNVGHMLNLGYEKILLMYNSAIYETADVINTYVYRRGITGGEYSFGAAVGLFQSGINFMLLVITNKISRRLSEISLW